jgi:SAM-dependent methyltransferase
MPYQTVGGVKGNSDSEAKLTKLRLPELKGKSFLDLGCNMGFFCRVAAQRGAARVVGVDQNEAAIAEARQLDPSGEYIAANWFDALRKIEGKFDVIVHLSAFHYVEDQPEFLRLLRSKLTPNGLFILECGVVASAEPRYVYIKRKYGVTRHVTTPLLDSLLGDFAVRKIARSVDQSGDRVPRFVYHCRIWQPTVVFVRGESYAGKSNLGKLLSSQSDAACIRMDELIPSLQMCPDAALSALMQDYFAAGDRKTLDGVAQAILDAGRLHEFCQAVAGLIPASFKLIALEGQIFSDGRFRQGVANILIERGFVCWDADRAMQREHDEVEASTGIDLLRHNNVEFHRQSVEPRLIRPKPMENELLMIARMGKIRTSACWSVKPSGDAQSFECSLRVDAKAKPIQFTFDVLDGATANNCFAPEAKPLRSIPVVLAGGDRYSRLAFSLPRTTGDVIVRITLRMANAGDPPMHAATYIAGPRIVPGSLKDRIPAPPPAGAPQQAPALVRV